MKKAEETHSHLVTAILIMLTVIVIGAILFPWFKQKAKQNDFNPECDISLVMDKILGEMTIGIADAPIQCKAKTITITNEDINTLIPLAKEWIKTWNDNPIKYSGAMKYYTLTNNENTNQELYQKWATNKIVADSLVNGWSKILRGALHDNSRIFDWLKEKNLCIITHRITFPSTATSVNTDEFTQWIANTPYKTGKTYYEELQGQSWEPIEYSYDPSKNLDIIYVVSRNVQPIESFKPEKAFYEIYLGVITIPQGTSIAKCSVVVD